MPVNFEKMDIFNFFLKKVLIDENIKIQDLHMPVKETKKCTEKVGFPDILHGLNYLIEV